MPTVTGLRGILIMSYKKRISFFKLVTKDLTATDSERRLFEGLLTVEMVDKQNEITIVDELMKALPIWMSRNAPISDTHSNRIVGRGISFQKTSVDDGDGNVYPAIMIQGEIHKDYELDNEIWEKIKNGTYKGLSFGGATKANRTPVRNKDGSISYALSDLEQYEVAVCEDPAVPLALILTHNQLAKANLKPDQYTQKDSNSVCVRCNKVGCYVDKWYDTKYTDKDPSRVEDHPEGEEWSSTMGRNKPYVQENPPAFKSRKDKKPEKITAGNQQDILGQDPNIHATGLPATPPQGGMESAYGGIGAKSHTKEHEEEEEELTEEEKTVNPGENLVMEKPIRGIRGTGGERSFDPIAGKAHLYCVDGSNLKDKYGDAVYDMTGIIDDHEEGVPRGEKEKPLEGESPTEKACGGTQGLTMTGVNGDCGKNNELRTYDDPERVEEKKEQGFFTGGIKGNIDTYQQDSGDSRQISVRDTKDREAKHGRTVSQVSQGHDGYSLGKALEELEIAGQLIKLKYLTLKSI